MPVEIKQLIVKSTLAPKRDDKKPAEAMNLETLKQQILEECREMIEQSRLESQER